MNLKLTAFTLIAALFLAGCSGGSRPAGDDCGAGNAGRGAMESIRKRGKIVAGVKFDTPPWGFMDENNEPTGFDIDLVRKIAEKLGYPVEFSQVTSKTRIPLLVQGNVDFVAASMTHNRQRDEAIDFTIAYFMDGQSLLVKADSGIRGVRDMAGKRVSAVQGSTSEKNIAEAQPDCEIKTFQEYPAAFLALKQGKVDALTTDSTVLASLRAQAENPDDYAIAGGRFSSEPLALGVRENDSDLRDSLNLALMEMWEDGSYQTLYDKWFGPEGPFPLESDFEMQIWP